MRDKRPSRIHEFGRPDATEFEIGRKTHRVADVPPLDVDGVRTMTVGTILWAVLAIGLVPFWGTLQETGRGWWLWTAIAGFGLGLMGIEFCRMRRAASARAAAATEVAPRRPAPTQPSEPVRPSAPPKPRAASPKPPVSKRPEPKPPVSTPPVSKRPAQKPPPKTPRPDEGAGQDKPPTPGVGRRRKN